MYVTVIKIFNYIFNTNCSKNISIIKIMTLNKT